MDTEHDHASQAANLDEAERQMLISGTFGEDRWAQTLLLAKGLISYRRRYLVFGPRRLRVTTLGKKVLREL